MAQTQTISVILESSTGLCWLGLSLQACLAPAPPPGPCLEKLRGRKMQPVHPILPWNSLLSMCLKTYHQTWCLEISGPARPACPVQRLYLWKVGNRSSRVRQLPHAGGKWGEVEIREEEAGGDKGSSSETDSCDAIKSRKFRWGRQASLETRERVKPAASLQRH